MKKRATLGLWLALATAGCSGSVAGHGTADLPVSTTVNLGPQQLTLQLPPGYHLDQVSSNATAGCRVVATAVLDPAGHGVALVQLATASCPDRTRPVLNGFIGLFATRDDVAGKPQLEEKQVRAGQLATFTEKYTACTNSCTNYQLKVAVVFLAHPADPALSAVDIIQEPGSTDIDPGGLAEQLVSQTR